MKRAANKQNRGFTLLEMLAYIACLGFVLASTSFVFVSSNRLHATGSATMERQRVAAEVRRAFMRDVREARNVSGEAAKYATSEDRLLLELPSPSAAGDRRFVAYGIFNERNRLGRHEFLTKPDGSVEYLRLTAFPVALEATRIFHDTTQPLVVGLEIDVDRVGTRRLPPGYRRKTPVTYSMTATIRSMEGGAR